ncbi:MAG: MCE family protein [Solirubrobacterales bacterium]|nr:MCE family protein [Solirubrobacterales bacterium]
MTHDREHRRRLDPRRRRTRGVNGARLRLEFRRASLPSLAFASGLAVMAVIVAYYLINISPGFGRDSYKVRFAVPQNYGVFPGFDDVRFRGVPVGTIEKAERDGSRLILVAKLRKDAGVVYNDAKAQIRPITPLNDVYLDIVDPGTKAAGRATPDRPLDESQTQTSTTVPDVLDIFDEDVQRNTYRILDQLGNGMADGGARLRRAFLALEPFLTDAGQLTQQIALRETDTKQLITNTALLTRALADRERGLRRLVATGSATVGTLGASSGALDQTVAELAPTLEQLQSSLRAVRGVVGDVNSGVTSLYPVADRLPTALTSLQALAPTLDDAATALRTPVAKLAPFAGELGRVANHLAPITAAFRPLVPTVNRTSRNLVDCEKGVIGFFQWNASLTKFGDANGPVPRGNLAFGVPDSGVSKLKRSPVQACTPGMPPAGVVTEKDKN